MSAEAPLRAGEAARRILEALREGRAVVEVVRLDAGGGDAGRRRLVWAEGALGGLGTPRLDRRATELALESLDTGDPRGVEVDDGEAAAQLYLQPHRPPDELTIVGAGHIARPLARIGAALGFRVLVLDDRPGFATRERFPEAAEVVRADFSDPFRDVPLGPRTHLVLVTRGHKYDFEALRDALRRPAQPAYVGMVGSRRRVRATFEALASEGIPMERLRSVHAPIGLDLGAETPEEIAVAIAAELVLTRRGGTGTPLRDAERVVERWLRDRE